MPLRRALLCLSALTAVACQQPPASQGRTPRPQPQPAQPTRSVPMPTRAPPTEPPAEAGGEPRTLLLQDSGLRCITFPCPIYSVQPVGEAPGEPRQVHELDLSALGSDAERERVEEGVARGVRVEGTLSVRRKAGPAGDATVLRVTRLLK